MANDDSLKDAATDLSEAAVTMGLQFRRTVGVVQGTLAEVAHEHPFTLLAGAAGIGFVVGGGLASTFSRAAIKIAGAFVVESALDALMQSNTPGPRRATSSDDPPSTTSNPTSDRAEQGENHVDP
jgi:hypothetical protein